jgi:hypothetical protein
MNVIVAVLDALLATIVAIEETSRKMTSPGLRMYPVVGETAKEFPM